MVQSPFFRGTRGIKKEKGGLHRGAPLCLGGGNLGARSLSKMLPWPGPDGCLAHGVLGLTGVLLGTFDFCVVCCKFIYHLNE